MAAPATSTTSRRTAPRYPAEDRFARPAIPAIVRARFPRRADHEIVVESACRRRAHGTPTPPCEACSVIELPATAALLQRLLTLGYATVLLRNSGSSPAHREAPIHELV